MILYITLYKVKSFAIGKSLSAGLVVEFVKMYRESILQTF